MPPLLHPDNNLMQQILHIPHITPEKTIQNQSHKTSVVIDRQHQPHQKPQREVTPGQHSPRPKHPLNRRRPHQHKPQSHST
jgi:hypothetical protein